MLLHAPAEFGYQLLGGFGKSLGQGERGQALDQRGEQNDPDQRIEQLEVLLADNVVDQVFGGRWKHKAGDAVDDHQQHAEGEQAPAWPDQLHDLGQGLEDLGFLPRAAGKIRLRK